MWIILTYNSVILEAPSKAFSSIRAIRFCLKSTFAKLGKRPNRPSECMRSSTLSLSNLKVM